MESKVTKQIIVTDEAVIFNEMRKTDRERKERKW